MLRVTGAVALLASVALGTLFVRGLRHFDLRMMRTSAGTTLEYPGTGPYRHLDDPTAAVGRRLISWDNDTNCWSINNLPALNERLSEISYNGDVCHREFVIPLVGWASARTIFIPLQETANSRSRAHSWAILFPLGSLASTPLLLWGIVAVVWVLATSRRRSGTASHPVMEP